MYQPQCVYPLTRTSWFLLIFVSSAIRELVLPALYLLQRKIQIYAQHIIVYILSLLYHVGFICCFGYDISVGRDTDFFFFKAVCMLWIKLL